MKVFISWSGNRSKAVATLLNEWLQLVLQAVRPWMSTEMDRGSVWFAELTNQLKDTTIGIVCLTQDNLEKPWILFESGAVAKGLERSRICTFLIDLAPTDVSDPLAQFNHTTPSKEGLFALVSTLNKALGDGALQVKTLEDVFNTYWPRFESGFEEILEKSPDGEHTTKRAPDDLLVEILKTVRNIEHKNLRITSNQSAAHSPLRGLIRAMLDNGLPAKIIQISLERAYPNEDIPKLILMENIFNDSNSIDDLDRVDESEIDS